MEDPSQTGAGELAQRYREAHHHNKRETASVKRGKESY